MFNNSLIIKGNPVDVKDTIDSFYRDKVTTYEDFSTREIKRTHLTFNSYIKANDEKEAFKNWGTSDTLGSCESTFDEAKGHVEDCIKRGSNMCLVRVLFLTHNRLNLDWVKEVVKKNPLVGIDYTSSCIYEDEYLGYKFINNEGDVSTHEEKYNTMTELYAKFLNANIDILFSKAASDWKIDIKEGLISTDRAIKYLREEFIFLPEEKFNNLLDTYAL